MAVMSGNTDHPHVGVIIPSYNAGSMLHDALNSVLDQTYENHEVVVVDDGSDDGFDYAKLCKLDPRVRYIHQHNLGPSIARNTGILASQCPYICFLDADDVWDPTKLASQVALMESHPDSPLCYTDYSRGKATTSRDSVLARYRPRRLGQTFADLLRENFVCTSTVLVRRSALAKAGLFDPNLRGAEDYDLWLRLARTGEFLFLDSICAHKSVHPGNLSATLLFHRELEKFLKSLLNQWGRDPDLNPLIKSKLSEVSLVLAYEERINGNFREAQRSYLDAARHGKHKARPFAMAGLMSLPAPAFRLIRDMLKGGKGRETE
jgi:glycosyltransferase involved in cell wall biosynthesis